MAGVQDIAEMEGCLVCTLQKSCISPHLGLREREREGAAARGRLRS